MNYNDISHFFATKKRGPSTDDSMVSAVPRKKFISEESFARDMAAMTIDPNNAGFQNHFQLYTQPAQRNSTDKNVVHIDDVDQFLAEEAQDRAKSSQKYKIMHTIVNGKSVYDTDVNGLPLVVVPGDSKPRIPDFVLKNTSLADPRDRLAYEQLMKSVQQPQRRQVQIEVLNGPSTHYDPTDMDID